MPILHTALLRDELIPAYLAGAMSTSGLCDAMGWPPSNDIRNILTNMAYEYDRAPCSPEGPTKSEQATLDRIVARAVARIDDIIRI